MATDRDNLAPRYVIDVGGTELDDGITQYIQSVEYESIDGIADEATIDIQNPNVTLQDLKIFQPGNEMSIWMGYGLDLEHIGRVILRKVDWDFPEDDVPSGKIVGYTFDCKMMDNEPEEGKFRRYKNTTFADLVRAIADRYPLVQDIDDTPDAPSNRVQPAGLSDYRVIKSCANLAGYFFWIDGNELGTWTIHFKSPSKVLDAGVQPDRTFTYNDGDLTTLLSFQPQMLIQGTKTKIKVQVKDPKTGKVTTEEIEDIEASPDVEALDATSANEDEIFAAQSIKIFFQEFSFEVENKKRFKTAAEATQWAVQWFRRQKSSFILGDGRTVGIADLRARQFHTLEGIGNTYSGKWYFSKVRHTLSEGSGYDCEFHARKQESLEK